jgi:nucleotide-binding universal stress UspA family protein
MGLHKLLVAIDFSLCSDIAVQHALNIANASGAAIVLAHVWDPSARSTAPFAHDAAIQLHQSVLDQTRAAHRDEVAARAAGLRDRGVHARHLLLEGDADEEICKAARHEAADLILTGTRGRTGVSRVLLGSVAERILRHSHVPVMIARRSRRREYKHILVPTDFTPHAEHALFNAVRIAPRAGVIDMVHFWSYPLHTLANVPADTDRAAFETEATERAAALVADHRSHEVDIRFECIQDRPARGILRRLDAGDYDLVCVGSHGRRGVSRLVLGSVAEATARHAPCSAMVCHAPVAV